MAVTISLRIESIVLESVSAAERTVFERALRDELATRLTVRRQPDPTHPGAPGQAHALARSVARAICEKVEERIDQAEAGE